MNDYFIEIEEDRGLSRDELIGQCNFDKLRDSLVITPNTKQQVRFKSWQLKLFLNDDYSKGCRYKYSYAEDTFDPIRIRKGKK
jgi:hypothetical protein